MKNFTNNFKQFTSRLSARWLIMALMMLVGTSSAWGAVKLYLSPSANWKQADAYFAAYFYGNGEKWVKMSYDSNSGYYVCDDPTTYPNVIFCRMNPSGTDSNNNYLNWNNRWHQTSDLTGYSTNGNCYAIKEGTWDKGGGTWSTYTPPCDVTLSVSKNPDANIYLTSESVTLTATATNQTSITWKKGDTTLGTDNSYAYTQSEVGNVTIKAIAANTTCNVEKTVDLAFVNQKAIKITTNGNYYLYTWNGDNTDGTKNWPGIKGTHEGDVYVWTIETTKPINAILNNGKNQPQTADINNLQVGYEYYLEWDGTGRASVSTDDKEELPKPCTTADVQIISGPSDICPGGSTSFTYTAAQGANITWKMESASSAFAFTDNNGTVTVRHSNPSTIVNGANKILYTVTDANDICPASDVDTEKTITLLSVPSITASTSTTQNICYGTKATLTVTSNQGTYTWVSSDGGEAIDSKTNSVTVSKAGTYTVTAQNAGGCTSNKITFTVTVKDPVAAPTLNPKSATVCGGEAFTLLNIDGVTWSLDGKPTTGSQPGIANNTDAAIIKTFQAVKEVDGCLSAPADYKVTVNPTPVITGESVAQPGKKNAITLKLQGTLEATWEISGGDIDKVQGNSILFSAETNGTYTIKATTEEGCFDTHVVNVADAFYVYMRQPKKGENAYNNFYYPDQNPTQGGDLFYKEYASIPPAEGYTDYNTGGVAHDIIFTDCDGYVWYGFKASDKLIDGTNYFTVRAPNLGGTGGYYTHTYLTKPGAMTSDIYYTMNENASGSSQGWYITKVSAPYAGPVVHASGSTALGSNKFAALYVTDCSGKEIDTYQWQSSSTQNGTYTDYAASVTNSGTLYSGDAGTTNNIRPATDGWYRCKVTYKDGSTVTSEPVQVTGSYTHASSTLPVIIVNTNGVGFPVNNFGGTPSKNADEMKAKRSVDVKIYQGKTMVYDRKARMNYRGSSSLNFLKKSYAFCPGKDNCVEDKGRQDYVKTEKMNMLGIGTAKDKDWVLYAAAADPSLMRNRLMFDTFRDMTGGWSVNSRYVELYVDGEYKGVYVMMDKVTKNEGRVNITDPNGFIVKFDKTDLVDRYEADGDKKTFKSLYSGYDGESGNGMKTYDTYIDQRFEIEYPEMEDVEEDNPGMWAKTVNDIKTIFNNFESNLKAGNYAEVQKIIDYTSWADWFIISEYAKNMDAYRASCIFVYDGDKIEARPLWDQELSFNNQCANLCSTYGCNSTTGLLIENSKIYEEGCSAPFWFTGKYVGGRGTEAKSGAQFEGYLLNDPCFIAVLKERWALHTATGGALTKDVMTAKISGYETDLGAIGTANTPFNRELGFWSGKSRETIDCGTGSGCYDGSTGYSAYNTQTNISNSVTLMKNWINGNRRTNLGTLITNMKGSPLSISFMPQEVTTTPWEPITLQVVNTSSYDYTITYTDGELDKQSGVIINKTDDTFKINVPRPDKWGIGNEKVEGERADITYGIKATLNVADGTTVCGKSEVTPATATIILQDEPNEDCNNN